MLGVIKGDTRSLDYRPCWLGLPSPLRAQRSMGPAVRGVRQVGQGMWNLRHVSGGVLSWWLKLASFYSL